MKTTESKRVIIELTVEEAKTINEALLFAIVDDKDNFEYDDKCLYELLKNNILHIIEQETNK